VAGGEVNDKSATEITGSTEVISLPLVMECCRFAGDEKDTSLHHSVTSSLSVNSVSSVARIDLTS
jgi:hypothetical protein